MVSDIDITNPVPIIPTAKHIVAISDDLCIFFSTTLPKNAADIPKKKIAKLNAHSTAPFPSTPKPIASAISLLKYDQH